MGRDSGDSATKIVIQLIQQDHTLPKITWNLTVLLKDIQCVFPLQPTFTLSFTNPATASHYTSEKSHKKHHHRIHPTQGPSPSNHQSHDPTILPYQFSSKNPPNRSKKSKNT